jgi:hypothetical protein
MTKQCPSCGAEVPQRGRCASCMREYSYNTKYGITIQDYDDMFEDQGGVCKICSLPQTNKRFNHLCVDHDHETGEVRGLLCDPCNRAIGLFKDDSRLLDKAREYLRSFKD